MNAEDFKKAIAPVLKSDSFKRSGTKWRRNQKESTGDLLRIAELAEALPRARAAKRRYRGVPAKGQMSRSRHRDFDLHASAVTIVVPAVLFISA